MRPSLIVFVVVAALGAQPQTAWPPLPPKRSGIDASLELPRTAEFPARDEGIWALQRDGLRAKVAARRLAYAPDRADTLDLLLQEKRIDDAFRVLRRILDTRPDQIAPAFDAVSSGTLGILDDASHGYAEVLREFVAHAKSQQRAMPREQAAQTARHLLSLDHALSRQAPYKWPQSLATFASDYSDTEEGVMAQVDVLMYSRNSIGPQEFDRVDEFIQAHPGTTAAAKALYLKGFHLGVNSSSLAEGGDPTHRFFRVLKIAEELESGKYPASQWVSDTPLLVFRSSMYRLTFAPGNLDRVLKTQEEYVKAHLFIEDHEPVSNTVKYFITNDMAKLFALKGDAIAGVEGVLSRLAQSPGRSDAVQYLRAEFYLRPPDDTPEEQRQSLRTRAQRTLESLYASATGFYKRKALATLAALHFDAGRYANARRLYQQYVDAYPGSAYAWVAALRIGQCDESMNNPTRAVDAFRKAAAQDDSNPLARVLGHAYAARASEAAGDFRQALVDYESALAAWDDDYGLKFSLYSMWRASPAGPSSFVDGAEVAKHALPTRISQLQRATSMAGGTVVERGRWLLMHSRWDDALAALSPLLQPSSHAAFEVEARYLSHQARLQRALDATDLDTAGSDNAKALEELEALSREPFDFAVGAAKIALASLMSVGRATGDASAWMSDALIAWHAADRQETPAAPRGALERDAVEVRNAVFLPKGGGIFDNSRWDASLSGAKSARFLVVDPDLEVQLSDGKRIRVTAWDRFPGLHNMLFLTDERRILLERIMTKVGGTKKRTPGAIMETPNQPVGPSLDVLALWQKFFAAQPGHWGGWVFETYPIIVRIEFIDAGRTRAAVPVVIGYSGATVQMEKKDGVWSATALTNFWVT